jgi:hypothetical protein
MKQFVIMNKITGEIDIGIRINLFDRNDDSSIIELPNYKIHLTPDVCDAWLMHTLFMSGQECWIYIDKKIFESKCEIVCEL